MAHQHWNIERDARRGVRATVKVYPTGVQLVNGMRYRMLRGPWMNSGNEMRDYYESQQALRLRVAALEERYNRLPPCTPARR